MNSPIDRAIAKEEIERIDEVLDCPHILIGGLAVQQYHAPRVSKDIDLVCDFKTAQRILDTLYPTKDWKHHDDRNNDYRPSFRIKHKFEDKGTIIFGPKIVERKAYEHIDWEALKEESRPFRGRNNVELTNIYVPPPHALAYTKLISFLNRSDSAEKVCEDLKDFVNLTNNDGFSSSRLYDMLRRSNAADLLIEEFRNKSTPYDNIVADSSLYSLMQLFSMTSKKSKLPKSTAKVCRTIYLAAPHKNISRNHKLAENLRSAGFKVVIPYEEVAAERLKRGIDDSDKIRQVCIEAILVSDFVVVDLDTYGMDTAWEIGYGEGLGKRIIGYNEDEVSATSQRFINRREYAQNFMHGWSHNTVVKSLPEVVRLCEGKSVYICGSFNNPEVIELEKTTLKEMVSTVIFPRMYIDSPTQFPKDYPFSERAETIKLLKNSDIVLVVLPRYGMDASWQIGYAQAQEKEIIGLQLTDDNRELEKESFWDHWMHGWKYKTRAIGLDDLNSIVIGLSKVAKRLD